MITPIELQGKTFKSGIGYDKKDVDKFIKEVALSYESVYKENVELNDKINVLNEGIHYYKTIESTLQKALVLAETTAEETKEVARQKAKGIEEEARVRAGLLLFDAKKEMDTIHQKITQLLQQYELYKVQFKQLAQTQVELLNSESFQIHIANLDAFIKEDSKSNEEMEEEIPSKEIEVEDLVKEVEKVEEAKVLEEEQNTEQQKVEEEISFIDMEHMGKEV